MLSSSLSISEFIEIIKGRSYEEIIWMTDQEATEAERRIYKKRINPADSQDKLAGYARDLKDFILYMRHGVRTSTTRDLQLDEFKVAYLQN
ncbi:MAG: hypothetical protein HKP58_07625 [Desulfatitalea sp.]|nr:hypothetical protein [Desulfatitalea sp.]